MNIFKYFYNLFSKPSFYENKDFKLWVKNSKVFFLLRGPPGSQTLSLSRTLCDINKQESTDAIKVFDGDHMLDDVRSSMEANVKIIIAIVNGIYVKDVRPYINLAQKYYYMTIVPDFMNLWKYDIKEAIQKSKGDVAEIDIEKEFEKFEELPVYYAGWFLSDMEQCSLHNVGRQSLHDMWNNESVRNQLQKETGATDVDQYWPQQKQRLHVTSKFIGGDLKDPYVHKVMGSLCSISEMTVTGILLTPRTFSCHIVLMEKDWPLFADQDLVTLKPHVTLAVGGSNKAVQSGPDQVEVQRLICAKVPPNASFHTDIGTVDDYGQCRFYLTLNKEQSIHSLFNFFY